MKRALREFAAFLVAGAAGIVTMICIAYVIINIIGPCCAGVMYQGPKYSINLK